MSVFKDREDDEPENTERLPPLPEGAGEGPPPPPTTAPIEFWAERKGHLPGVTTAGRANPSYWKYAAASASHGWAPGQQVSEKDFDEAIENQGKHVSR